MGADICAPGTVSLVRTPSTPHIEAKTHRRQCQAMVKLKHPLMPYGLEGFTGGWLALCLSD